MTDEQPAAVGPVGAPPSLLSSAFGIDDEHLDPVAERILDAARDQFSEFGVRRTAMADIAKRAGVGRVTIYRRFADRDALLAAVTMREVRRLLATVDAATVTLDTLEERIVEGFVVVVREVHDPLLQRVIDTDPELLLPLLTRHGSPVITAVRDFVVHQLRLLEPSDGVAPPDPGPAAEVVVRLLLSLVLTPQSVLPLADGAELREFVRRSIVPLILQSPRS